MEWCSPSQDAAPRFRRFAWKAERELKGLVLGAVKRGLTVETIVNVARGEHARAG